MSQSPDFQSEIPQELLNSLEPKEKYMFEQMSIMSKKTDWLIGETKEQSIKLNALDKGVEEVDTKLKFTNGKIASALLKIDALEGINKNNHGIMEEVKKIVNYKHLISKFLSNKFTWICIGIFIFGAVKILTSPELRTLLAKIVGIE